MANKEINSEETSGQFTRLGRHGSLVFLKNQQGRLIGFRDEQYRKDIVRFQELSVPDAETLDDENKCYKGVFSGPCWDSVLRGMGHDAPVYHELNDKLAGVGRGFRLANNGFEESEILLSNAEAGRSFSYFQLNEPTSALLTVNLLLKEPFCYRIECDVVAWTDSELEIGNDYFLWPIGTLKPIINNGILEFSLPRGNHKIEFVVWSKPPSRLLTSKAMLIKRKQAWLAALGSSYLEDELLTILPIDNERDLVVACSVIDELGIEQLILAPEVNKERIESVFKSMNIIALQDGPALVNDLEKALGVISSNRDASPFRDLDPAIELIKARNDRTRDLSEPHLDQEIASSFVRMHGLVICDCNDAFTRVVAAAYACATGTPIWLGATEETPIAPPKWEKLSPTDYATAIASYRTSLSQQVTQLIPPWLAACEPREILAFTRGFPYSLVKGKNGLWGLTIAIGHLPGAHAHRLLFKGLYRSTQTYPPFSVTLVCDSLTQGNNATEATAFFERLTKTVSRPMVLEERCANRKMLSELSSRLPVDLIILICHGEGEDIFLDDGPMSSTEINCLQLKAGPVVLNNSCSSWSTTGPAFLQAGASAYIGTLWPITQTAAEQMSITCAHAITENSELEVGDILQQVIAELAKQDMDDASAYFLVGLPSVMVRMSNLTDEQEKIDVAEQGLQLVYDIAHQLLDDGNIEVAKFLISSLGQQVGDQLKDKVLSTDIPQHLRIINLEGEHVTSFLATLEAIFKGRLVFLAGEAAIPGGIDHVIQLHEQAVSEWESGHERMCNRLNEPLTPDESFGTIERRILFIPKFYASLIPLLSRYGRFDEACRIASKAASVRKHPKEQVHTSILNEVMIDDFLDLSQELPDPDEFLNCLGIAMFNLDNLETAERLYLAALNCTASDNDVQVGRIQSNIGQVLVKRGKNSEAKDRFRSAMMLLDKSKGDPFCAFITRLNQGRLEFEDDNFVEAEFIARDLVERADTLGLPYPNKQAKCNALKFHAEVLLRLGKRDEAESVALSTLDIPVFETESVNRLMCAFSALNPAEFDIYPRIAARACQRIHAKAVWIGDVAVAWKAMILSLTLSGKSFNMSGDLEFVEQNIDLLESTLSLHEDGTNRYIPEFKAAVARFLSANTHIFTTKTISRITKILKQLEPDNPRWESTDDLLQKVPSSHHLLTNMEYIDEPWKRKAFVRIAPPDRTVTTIFDCPPNSIGRPLYVRFPLTIQVDNGAQPKEVIVQNTSCWLRMRNAVLYRCDGECIQLTIKRRGLVQLHQNFIRYEEVWGSELCEYSVAIMLPPPAVPIGFGIERIGSCVFGPDAKVTVHEDCVTVSICPNLLIAKLREMQAPIPFDIAARWMGRIYIDFVPDEMAYQYLIESLDLGDELSFDEFSKMLDRVHS